MEERAMSLLERIKADLTGAMKAKAEEKKSVLRVILGELGRQPQKDLPDAEVVKIIKKLIKSEKEVLAQSGGGETNHFIVVSESYLPRRVDEAEIRTWIASNIDFAAYKNKMQAMGPILKHFGESADGATVKKVLEGMG
jgi:uncharacterized protein YqeY